LSALFNNRAPRPQEKFVKNFTLSFSKNKTAAPARRRFFAAECRQTAAGHR